MVVLVGFEAAWAAGFFDGEGTTSVLKTQRDKYSYFRMSVPQKYPELLERFLNIVKVGRIYKHSRGDMYSWNCYKKEDVIETLNMLWPFLGETKKLQALKAITFTENYNGKTEI